MSNAWPALDYETLEWTSTAEWGAPRAQRAPTSYRAAVPARIAGVDVRLEPEVARDAADAARELTRLDAELGHRVAAFAPVLLRSEAASSSQIENLTASARAIFSAELGGRVGPNAHLVAANTRALQSALLLADDVSADSVLSLHRTLLESQPRHTPGRWRAEAVWIGTRADSPAGAEYVAPHHARVPGLIDDLVDFSLRDDVEPLAHVALAHAQFETIHPFTDGNGRTGRALAQALLRRRDVTRHLALPVSAGLLADVEGYHASLTAYRSGSPEAIVRAFAQASLRAVENTRRLVAEIDEVTARWPERLTVRRSSHAWALLEVVARRPVLTAAMAADALGIQTPNVYPALRTLVEAGILRSRNEHRVGPFWRSDEVLAAIDRFAERAGRRTRA